MISVFADTFYWLALINPRDQAHQEALTLYPTLREPVTREHGTGPPLKTTPSLAEYPHDACEHSASTL